MEENELKELGTLIDRMGETESSFALLFEPSKGYTANLFWYSDDGSCFVDGDDITWYESPSKALKNFYYNAVCEYFTDEIQLDISKEQYDTLSNIAAKRGILVDELISQLLSDTIPE